MNIVQIGKECRLGFEKCRGIVLHVIEEVGNGNK